MSGLSEFLSAPKGLLKIFILKATSKMPVSGTDILNQIRFYTNDEWRPSPGSIYFILNELLSKGMISEVMGSDNNVKKYVITNKGMDTIFSFLKVADRVLRKQFIFISVMAQVAEKDLAKTFFEIVELVLTSNKGKQEKLETILNQLIFKLKRFNYEA
ncbi:MAG: PadR family transcriptional regulator [Nitrososphaerales archaeon]